MARGKPLLRRLSVDGALDLNQFIDAPHRLRRNRGLSRFRQVEELSAAVAPAGCLKDRRWFPIGSVEIVVAVEGIGLHQTNVASKMALRMLSSPVARVIEQRRRRIVAAKWPVIANIRPDPADHGLHFRQHRDRGVVGMDAFRAHDMGPDGLNKRLKRHHAGADPIRQRRDIDLDALAGIGLTLTVQRLVQ